MIGERDKQRELLLAEPQRAHQFAFVRLPATQSACGRSVRRAAHRDRPSGGHAGARDRRRRAARGTGSDRRGPVSRARAAGWASSSAERPWARVAHSVRPRPGTPPTGGLPPSRRRRAARSRLLDQRRSRRTCRCGGRLRHDRLSSHSQGCRVCRVISARHIRSVSTTSLHHAMEARLDDLSQS